MKRIIGLLLFVFTASMAFAQGENTHDEDEGDAKKVTPGLHIPTQVGNMLVGADLLFAQASFQKGLETNYNVGISPKVGVFVLPNIALGLSLDLSVEGHTGYRAINYGVSPFARVYFAHQDITNVKPLQFFIEGGVGFGGTNSHFDSPGISDATTNGIRLYIIPGVDYFLNNRVAVETGLQYLFIGGNPDAHILALNVGFQVFLGR